MKTIIPAAGLGTRFLPWTKACPKEMLPILDKPVIQWVIEEVLKSGLNDFIIVISEGKEAIVKYFSPDLSLESFLKEQGKEERLSSLNRLLEKINITFVYQKGPYGNASPILSAKRHIPNDEPFLVVWGDEFIFSNPSWIKQLVDVNKKHNTSVLSALEVGPELMKSKGMADPEDYKDGLYRLKGIVEKPGPDKAPSNMAISGAYLLTSEIWPYLNQLKPGKDNEVWLVDAINAMAQDHTVLAKIIKNGKFWDVGTKNKYYKLWREAKCLE